jgi:hypothetical protein
MTTAGNCRRVGAAATGSGATLTGTEVAVGVTDGTGVAVRVRVGERVGEGVTVGVEVGSGVTLGRGVAVGMGVTGFAVARTCATSGVGVTSRSSDARCARTPHRSAKHAATMRARPRRFRIVIADAVRLGMAPL